MKTTKFSIFGIIIPLFCLLFMSSCSNDVRNIPAGYVGKELTPTGWGDDIHEAGQVDIGEVSNNGTSTSLVLLEVTTTTVKEQFLAAGETSDGEDHRVRTKDGTPLSVDIYVQISIPTDKKIRDGIFSMITPVADTGQNRVSVISVSSIYERFAKMAIRGNTRVIFAKYKDADDVMQNYEKVNAEISEMIISVVKDSKAPFEIMSAQLSNVKEDPVILDSKNKLTAAANEVAAINMVGEAIRTNPNYLEIRRLEVLEKIGTQSSSNLIVMDTKSSPVLTLPAPATKPGNK